MSIKGIASLAELMDTPADAGTQEIDLSLIDPDPNQPRTSFDEMRLETLAASLKAQGVIEPLIVSPHPETDGRYMLIAGERRWRAAGMAGLTRVAVVVRELTDEQRLAVQLVENIDREELSVMEEALAVARLLDFGRKPKEVAEMLGKNLAWVSLRKKIATHQGSLEYFVVEGRTRDAETLAMLADLEKLDSHMFGELLQMERVARSVVREALDAAKRRKLAAVVTPTPAAPTDSTPGDPPADPAPTDKEAVSGQEDDAAQTTVSGTAGEGQKPAGEKKRQRTDTDPPSAPAGAGDPYASIQEALAEALGLPVRIEKPRSGKPGSLRIEFVDLLELEALRQNLT